MVFRSSLLLSRVQELELVSRIGLSSPSIVTRLDGAGRPELMESSGEDSMT